MRSRTHAGRERSSIRTALKWTAVALGVMVLSLLLVAAFMDWNRLKGPIERLASAHTGRSVQITGPIEAQLWSTTPQLSISGLRLGNPPWEASRPMASIKRITVNLHLASLLRGDVVLPRVVVEQPDVYLHREANGRANWTFASTRPTNAPAAAPRKLPVIQNFVIDEGKLTVIDELRKLTFDAQVYAHERPSRAEPKPFRLQGQGQLNDKPFSLRVAGGPLINLEPGEPYAFDLTVLANTLRITSSGIVPKPFDLGMLQFKASLSGKDLADLYYLTQLTLPNTPPFEMQATIRRNGKRIDIDQIQGRVGSSDLRGQLTVDASRKRPALSGQLQSTRLVLSDLAASLGAPSRTNPRRGAAHPSQRGTKDAPDTLRIFPDAPLHVERVRGMDADVRYLAQSIEAGHFPLKDISLAIKLNEGVLSLQPFAFDLPQGRLSGTARIDARGKQPKTELDLRLQNVRLDQFKSKKPGATAPVEGLLQARATLTGKGASVHDFVSDAQGSVSAIVPHGKIRAAFAELTGINVARGLGLLIKGDQERAEIRCGVAQFKVDDGVMRAQTLLFDTHDVRVSGRGEIRLGPEELDLSLKGEPKKLRLLRLRTPIELNGHLRKPTLGVEAGKAAKQGAVAAAVGALTAPFAAIIAFVDPGLAKDADCAALLAQARNGSRTAQSRQSLE